MDNTTDESNPPLNSTTAFFFLILIYSILKDIFLGVNAIDYSGYPDCRPEFIRAFQKLSNLATKIGIEGQRIKIHTPLIKLTKKDIILTGIKNNVNFKITASCYNPSRDISCGKCDSCLLRKKGFDEAKIKDPILYDKNI